MLQPLVENAHHGIKNKRTGGAIVVRGRCDGETLLHVTVTDNGMGMTPARLAEVRNSLTRDLLVTSEGGYGLINVNQRIRLYYGQRYGLTIDSEYGAGTSQ
jgi:two-component system sensor histidine kinase YesM